MRRLTATVVSSLLAVSLCCHGASGKPVGDSARRTAGGRRLLSENPGDAPTYFQDASTPNLAEKCPLTRDSRPPPRKLQEIRWLHVPKTGSTFGFTVVHYICPGIPDDAHDNSLHGGAPLVGLSDNWMKPQYCDPTIKTTVYSNHQPLESKYIDNPKEAVVGVFRDPRRRNYSGWLIHGARGDKKHPWDLLEYTRLLRACQGRMLLGIDCNAVAYKDTNYFQPTPQQRMQAIDTLSRMAFVGLTEYWQETVCLFHAMFGGRITPHELRNVRPGVAAIRSGGRPHEAFMEIPIEEDPFDYEIFMVAKRIFATRLIEYGIRVPQDLL